MSAAYHRLRCIPRHQIETTLGDYAPMLAALCKSADAAALTQQFESRFAEFAGCRHAVAVSSGRVALSLVLEALQLPAGSEVIIPAFNYFAVVEQFRNAGLRPVFADIIKDDLNIDAKRVEALVTSKTRVLLATHMFGHPCDMDALSSIADRHRLILIEDCAHAMGSAFRGRRVGTFGRAGVFSLSAMKLITTFGGGVIVTNDDELASALRKEVKSEVGPTRRSAFRRFLKGAGLDWGTRTVPFSLLGWPALRIARMLSPNFQQRLMTEGPHRMAQTTEQTEATLHPFQLVLGLSQLDRVHEILARRRQVVNWLDETVDAVGHAQPSSFQPLRRGPHVEPNGMYYGLLTDRPDELSRFLFARGIDTATAEYRNCSALDIYRDFCRDCPFAAEAERRLLRLPNHPRLTRRDVERIAHAISRFYAASTRRGREAAGRVQGMLSWNAP